MAVNVTGGPLEFVAKIDNRQLDASLRQMEARINKSTSAAVKDAERMDVAFRNVATGIAAYFSVQQLSSFAKDVAMVRGEFQQLEIALDTIIGKKAESDKVFADAIHLAAVTPFSLRDVGQGVKQLLAYGFATEEVIEVTRRLGDVSAGLSIPLNDLIYLYGTTRVQQRLYTRDLIQFTGRGIPLMASLARQFGVAESEIRDLTEAGKIGFEHVKVAIEEMTDAGGSFANLMEKQSKTITGQISNLQDAWDVMLNDIGKSNEETISTIINLSREAVENYETILGILKVLIVTYGTYRAALIATAAAQGLATAAGNVRAWFELARGIRTAKDAQIAFNLAVRANPIGLIAGAIAGLITYLVVFRDETESLTAAQKNLNDVQINAAQAAATQEQKLKDLIAVAKDETALLSDRRKAISEINTISPQYLGNLNLETVRTEEATEATHRYIEALKEKATEEAIQAKRTEITRRLIEEQLTPASPTLMDDFLGGALNLFSFNQDRGFAAAIVSRRIESAKNERINGIRQELRALEEFAESQKKVNDEREAEPPVIKRTVAVIDEEIKALKDQQQAVSENRAQWEEFQNQINELEAEKVRITGELTKGVKDEIKAVEELRKQIQEFHREMELAPLGRYGRMLAEANDRFDQWVSNAQKKAPELIKQLEEMRARYPQLVRDLILKDNDITSVGEISSPGSGMQAAVNRQLSESLKTSSKSVIETESKRLKAYFTTLEAGTRGALQRTLRVLRQEMRRLEKEGFSDQYMDAIRKKAEEIEKFLGRQWSDDISLIADDVARISSEFSSLAGAIRESHPELAEILDTLGEIGSIASDVGTSIASFAQGNIIGGITSAIQAITGIFSRGARRREAERQAREDIADFQAKQLIGEIEINKQYRERLRLQLDINEATLEGIRQAEAELERQRRRSEADFDRLLKELQGERYVSGTNYIHKTWFRKARTEKEFASLAGKTFEEIAELFAKGQLQGTAAELFQNLQSIKDEMAEIADQGEEAKRVAQEILTGTTTDSIADGIIEGFRQGNLAAADFADNFEQLMQNAIISSVRDKLLGDRLDKFYEQFADFSESGAGLTESEITQLRDIYNGIITDAAGQLKQLQDISGIDISKTGQRQGLSGAIRRELTEATGSELAGLYRNQLDITKQQLQADLAAIDHLNAIELNTANTVARLDAAVTELQAINRNTKPSQTERDILI